MRLPVSPCALTLALALISPLAMSAASVAAPTVSSGDIAEQVRDELADGRYWRAIALCEQGVEQEPRDPLAWSRLGKVLFDLGRDPAGEAGNPAMLLGDASAAFSKALALDPALDELLPHAYDAHMAAGEYAAAAAVAARGVGTSTLAEGRPTGVWLERATRAERFQSWAHAPNQPDAYAGALNALENRMENARAARPEHGPLHLEHALLLESIGLEQRAAHVLQRGLELAPSDAGLHRKLIDLYVAADVPERLAPIYAALCETVPQDGLVWWYRAWVGIVLGERSRLEVDWETAEEELAQAARWAETAAERAPEHADGARRLRHRALLGTALCALAQNQDAIARERLTALLANAPDLRNESEGLGRSVISGLGTLGSHYVDNADFGAGAELALLVLEVLPDQASWWNNLGYMLRQHACYIQGAGDPAAARELFSESWSAYQRAVALNSESVRYTNDAALIQVYHLRDELPRAERMLLSAIAMGETQLDALGPDPEESARFPLALAVGDALENLGYLYYHVQPDPQNSRAFYERSLATDSGARWTVLEHLAALRGERDPVDEWPVAGRAPGEPAPAALIDWECSFDGARLRAELEGRPVFLYYRGAALSGLDGDFWLNALEQDGLASRLDATVPVVADLVRHTIGDRRRDGTRIACPRYGGIPCSAHVRAAQEFARFFAERNDGAGPGGNQEHFHLLNADGDELEWNEAFLAQIGLGEGEVTEEVALELPTPQPTRSRQQSRTDLVAATRGADAETLRRYATASTTAERAALEGFLFDSSAPDTERGAILSALAASFDDDSRALLAAGLHQTHDSQLQALAAASWSNGEDVAPLMRTLQWGLSEAAREAARQRLHDLASGAESLRYLAVAAR